MEDLIFLGICDKIGKVLNYQDVVIAQNILGLRNIVYSPIYPIKLNTMSILLLIPSNSNFSSGNLVFKSNADSSDYFSINLELKKIEQLNMANIQSIKDKPINVTVHSSLASSINIWNIISFEIPEEVGVISQPGDWSIYLESNNISKLLGQLYFFHFIPQPLTPEKILAIKSNPNSYESVGITLSCKECKSELNIYSSVKRDYSKETENHIWYEDVPDRFICKCSKSNIDLRYIKLGLHAVLGERVRINENEISVVSLYHKSNFEQTHLSFIRLLEKHTNEESIQVFLNENPILFHQFSPDKIIPKAPVLAKYKTDFAILSKTGTLYLIEIETASKKILKGNGDRSQELNHAIDQVTNWLYEVDNHKLAFLDALKLDKNEVTKIIGVVIVGRDSGADRKDLLKLKSTDQGRITFMTYDDLANSLNSLIANVM